MILVVKIVADDDIGTVAMEMAIVDRVSFVVNAGVVVVAVRRVVLGVDVDSDTVVVVVPDTANFYNNKQSTKVSNKRVSNKYFYVMFSSYLTVPRLRSKRTILKCLLLFERSYVLKAKSVSVVAEYIDYLQNETFAKQHSPRQQ